MKQKTTTTKEGNYPTVPRLIRLHILALLIDILVAKNLEAMCLSLKFG